MQYPRSIDEALALSLEELAPFGDFIGVAISQIPDSDNDNAQTILDTQLKVDRSKYHMFNVMSLGSTARIIVSGQNSKLVARAQEIYDDFKDWHKHRYDVDNVIDIFRKFMSPIFLKQQ